jgi:hypothetical protein
MTNFLDAVVYIGVSFRSISMSSARFEVETEEIACHMKGE